jgi:hypothetical protein
MVGRRVGRIDADRLDLINRAQDTLTFGQPTMRSRISPPGRTKGSVE